MAEPFQKSTLREYFESIVIAVILALFVRTWVVQAFKIPTGSMENNLLIGDHLLVNKFVFGPQLHRFAREADDALDEIALGLLWVLEHHDVEALDGPDRQHGALEAGFARAEHELVDEQVVADEEVVLHRAGRDLERLDDEGPDKERQDDRDDDRLEVLAERGLLEFARHSVSVPILSTARNAS